MANVRTRRLFVGLGFILPNILGFLTFTLVPLVVSFTLAFSNWDLHLHNMFRDEPLRFLGLDNFKELFHHPDFWQYFGNTMFLMMGIPFSMAGSLGAALLLSKDSKKKTDLLKPKLLVGAIMLLCFLGLLCFGLNASALVLLLSLLFGGFLIGGVLGGTSVYRTLFYMPAFTAGVATYILWKKLYNPQVGPFNQILRPVLDSLTGLVQSMPLWAMSGLSVLLVTAIFIIAASYISRLGRYWRSEEIGWLTLMFGLIITLVPIFFASKVLQHWHLGFILSVAVIAVMGWEVWRSLFSGRKPVRDKSKALGEHLMLSVLLLIANFCLLGISLVMWNLPEMASDGLNPPEWLTNFHWAKPSLMIMMLWMAIGSNNMILYLAGLSNISPELYEAAEIDGASRFQMFWNVTWPQLAPVTFFIFVMSMIHGLQGGFEIARTMTEGGPAGATTTMSYSVYIEGFETGRLGYASAVAWALFILVATVTLFNFKFGNRNTND